MKTNTTPKKPMTLAQAIKRFERTRTSPDDYKDISFSIEGLTRSVGHKRELEALKNCPVIKFHRFVGSVMDFSLETLKMSPSRKCKAVSIVLDGEKAWEMLKGISHK